MNMVERWFSAFTTKKLQRSAHRKVRKRSADIKAWVEVWNDDPKPLVWHRAPNGSSSDWRATVRLSI